MNGERMRSAAQRIENNLIQVFRVQDGEEAAVTRKWARLLDFALAIALVLALAGAASLHAAEWPTVRESDTLYPGALLGAATWPDVSADTIAQINASAAAERASAAPTLTLGDDKLLTGSVAVARNPLTPATFAARFPTEFTFEGGARYWYSIGQNRFAFTNGIFPFGNPTSTLDWDRMQGHSGEGFFRINHPPTNLFLKGVIGGGALLGGDMDDLDFLAAQANFSNTTSAVHGESLQYVMVDLGYSFEVPSEGIRFGGFVGYHYWHERMEAFGVLCNSTKFNSLFCGPAGSTAVSFGTPVDIFDTTWHALRIGGDARIRFFEDWTISAEIALVPYAFATNEDSHLLRVDLGPVPNIITHAQRGTGAEAEAFLNYAVTPNFEVGIGARYWGLFSGAGSVQFGPTLGPDFALTKLSTQRYGVLFQAKATF